MGLTGLSPVRPERCAVSAIAHRNSGVKGCNAAPVLVTLMPNHMTLFAGLPNRVLVWRFTSNLKEDAMAKKAKKSKKKAKKKK